MSAPRTNHRSQRTPRFRYGCKLPRRSGRCYGSFGVVMHLKFKKALLVGAAAGLIGAALVFGLCLWASTWQTATDVSVALSFRPWWRSRNWLATLVAFVFVGVVSGVLAALRPDMRSKR
jgi:hypothetical protein